jgi:hypothetical protein
MLRVAMRSLANYYKPDPMMQCMQYSNKNHKKLSPKTTQTEKNHSGRAIKIGLLKNQALLFPGANFPLGIDMKELLAKEGQFDMLGYQFCPNNSYSRVVYETAHHENSLKILDERYRLFDIASGTSIQKATKINFDTTSIENLKKILSKIEGFTSSQPLAARMNELKVQLYGANDANTKLIRTISKEIRHLMESLLFQNLNRVHNFLEFNQQLINYIEEENYLEQSTKALKIIGKIHK